MRLKVKTWAYNLRFVKFTCVSLLFSPVIYECTCTRLYAFRFSGQKQLYWHRILTYAFWSSKICVRDNVLIADADANANPYNETKKNIHTKNFVGK